MWMKNVNIFQIAIQFSLRMLLSICLISGQFKLGVAYKSVVFNQ